MEPSQKQRAAAYIISAITLLVAILALFHEPLTSPFALSAPDAPISALSNDAKDFPSSSAGGWSTGNLGTVVPPMNIMPRRFLQLVMPAIDYVLWGYIADMILLGISMLVLLKAMKISTPVACIGAIAMALSCHTTSLISAGHMSKNGMMPFAVLTLAFLHLAISRRSILLMCLSGICAGTALSEHYDVAYMFCIVAAAYGLFLVVIDRDKILGSKKNIFRLGAAILLGGFLTLTTFYPSISYITGRFAPAREEIVEKGQSADNGAQWIFATNWSLPPEELIEFIIPGIFGLETGSEKHPYWGRTGQDISFARTHAGLRNLRQHGVYLGVFQVLLAIFAAGYLFRRRIFKGQEGRDLPPLSSAQEKIGLFWSVLTPIIIIFAMGRYGPLYRIFYTFFPYARNIRCPIKFLHIVEVAVVVLFAFGLEIIYHRISQRKPKDAPAAPRSLHIASFALSVLMALTIIAILFNTSSLSSYWNNIGFGNESSKLAVGMILAIARSAALAAIFGALILSARTRLASKTLYAAIFLAITGLIIAADLVSVNLPYIKTNKATAFLYSGNDLISRIKSDSARLRTVAPVQDGVSSRLPEMFSFFNVGFLQALQGSSIDSDLKDFYVALQQNPFRLWQLTSTGLIFGPRQQLSQLLKMPDFTETAGYIVRPDPRSAIALTESTSPESNYLLLSYSKALPRAAVFYGWRSSTRTDALRALSSPDWHPEDYALIECGDVSSSTNTGFTPIDIDEYTPNHIELSAGTEMPALLLINDRFDPLWTASIDGQPAKVYRANGLMRGVFLEPGQHDVTLNFSRPYSMENKVKLLGLVSILLALGIVMLRRFSRTQNK